MLVSGLGIKITCDNPVEIMESIDAREPPPFSQHGHTLTLTVLGTLLGARKVPKAVAHRPATVWFNCETQAIYLFFESAGAIDVGDVSGESVVDLPSPSEVKTLTLFVNVLRQVEGLDVDDLAFWTVMIP